MSWAVEEWKEGLSPRVIQKIHELESQVDKLKKERQQRQFQLESLEAALQKQKQKAFLHLFMIRKKKLLYFYAY
uniref:Centromere protein Cenp-F N-terminal domain-containing protein n=1 Tax=Athene cunicularia TaxID=194338 RepID=A0A663LW26_ATHCN